MKKRILLVISALAVIFACVFHSAGIINTAGKFTSWLERKGVPVPAAMASMAPDPLAPNPAITITIDAQLNRHPIDPNIYGLNFANANTLNILNSPLNRYGGNRTSRYNWQQNTDSTAMDWYFQSYPDANVAGGIADNIIQNSINGNAEPMITIPMIDWIAKAGPNRSVLWSFSISKYGAQTGNDWEWYPDAGNGIQAGGGFVVNNNPNDANIPNTTAIQQAWMTHLINKWGNAANGGVQYYVLDNEHVIWYDTHRDVHPQGPTMEEIRDKMIAYGEMIRSKDPNAIIVGPEEYGWSGYFLSGYDKQECERLQELGDFSCWGNPPDRANHGGALYMDWLLDELQQREQTTGNKLLDVFTLHYYPQGPEYSDDVSTSTQLLRNRSTRSLWDPNYTDESWIGEKVQLIPRMKQWVNNHYPGLKIGITEYHWGAENHINGATAQADVLGIFGREGLDLATLYTDGSVDPNSFMGKAFRMYRNYDGNKSTFGDTSVKTTAPNPNNVAAFGAQRNSDGALTVMVISKYLSENTPVTLQLNNFQSTGSAQVWQLTSAGTIQNLAPIGFAGSSFSASVPPRSITLFVIPSANQNPDFGISCVPDTPSAIQGNNAQTTCSLTAEAGYNSSVTLDCSGLPAGLECSFGENPVVVPDSSVITIPANVAPGDYPFNVNAGDGVLSHSFPAVLHVEAGPGGGGEDVLFEDDFGDGAQSWTVRKGTWSESNGDLFSSTTALSEVLSPPAFAGCTVCSVEVELSINSANGDNLFMPWYKDSKNNLQVIQSIGKKKWSLKHKMNGIVKKASFSQVIQPGVVYRVKLTYDGQKFTMAINDVVVIPSMLPAGNPSGKLAFRVKSKTGAAVIGKLSSVSVTP